MNILCEITSLSQSLSHDLSQAQIIHALYNTCPTITAE